MISEVTTVEELAAIVSETLAQAGIIATLSGGGAVSIYTENRYVSEDLDFVTVAPVDELRQALEPIGFEHVGRLRLSVFEHPDTKWYLEFPPAPLSFGGTYVDSSDCELIDLGLGKLRIITPTHAIMDRLIAAAAWNEPQSLEQALMVAELQESKIDWQYLEQWVKAEGIQGHKEIIEFYAKTGRPVPR